MKKTQLIIGMPITVDIVFEDEKFAIDILDEVFDYFKYIDNKFSIYKQDSEISKINKNLINFADCSQDMKEIFQLAEKTKLETNGYFDIKNRFGLLDPSGIVKGWAITNASNIVRKYNIKNYYINAGGDIEVAGKNHQNLKWVVGIENPFNNKEIVKTLYLTDCGIATSGTYIRGHHIYNPKKITQVIDEIISLTVIGPSAYEADRFATPAFAMGKSGIDFIERQKGLEGYIIESNGIATMTSNFEKYTQN